MKKYIRTKNGNILNSSRGLTSMIVDKEDIVQQADNIEELCDKFVVDYGNDHTMFTYFWDLQRHNELYRQDYHKVVGWYAAIWTDKGLIYVAKMNKRGELELI